nr:unnamed protein product [Digitaria exilis]
MMDDEAVAAAPEEMAVDRPRPSKPVPDADGWTAVPPRRANQSDQHRRRASPPHSKLPLAVKRPPPSRKPAGESSGITVTGAFPQENGPARLPGPGSSPHDLARTNSFALRMKAGVTASRYQARRLQRPRVEKNKQGDREEGKTVVRDSPRVFCPPPRSAPCHHRCSSPMEPPCSAGHHPPSLLRKRHGPQETNGPI